MYKKNGLKISEKCNIQCKIVLELIHRQTKLHANISNIFMDNFKSESCYEIVWDHGSEFCHIIITILQLYDSKTKQIYNI